MANDQLRQALEDASKITNIRAKQRGGLHLAPLSLVS